MIERSIGGYRLERELGRGGQGSAWLAEDTRLKRRVVVKVLSSTALLSSRAIERFRREAEIASKLDHQGICTVYEAGIEDGVPFMAMRYVEGISLAKILESGSTFEFKSIRNPGSPSQKSDPSVLIDFESSQGLSETLRVASPDTATDSVKGRSTSSVAPGRVAVQKLLQIIEKTADALDYAHRMNVLHRDIKPANIMVTPDFSPVILDFGLARQTEDDHELTMTGEIFGTPAYMAPEQVTGRRETIDATSDVWGLGVTLYECLTGRRPFEAPTREGLYRAIVGRQPIDPRRLNAAISRDVAIVTMTALEKSRSRRYASAADFAEDLRRARTHLPIRARRAPPWIRLAHWCRRNPEIAGLTGVIVLFLTAAAVSIGFLLAKSSETRGRLTAEIDRLDTEIAAGRLASAEESLRRAHTLGLDAQTVAPYLERIESLRAEDAQRNAERASIAKAKSVEDNREAWRQMQMTAPTMRIRGGSIEGPQFLDFSGDGRLIVTTSTDRVTRIWDTDNGQELWTLPIDAQPGRVHFSDDRRFLAVDGGALWSVVDLERRAEVRTIEKSGFTGLGFSPGTHVLLSQGKRQIRFDRLTDDRVATEIKDAPFDPEFGRVFIGPGPLVYAATEKLELFDPATLELILSIEDKSIGHGSDIVAIQRPNGGRYVVYEGDWNKLVTIDVAAKRVVGKVNPHEVIETVGPKTQNPLGIGVAVSNDAKTLFIAYSSGDVAAVDASSGNLIAHRRPTCHWMGSDNAVRVAWMEEARCLVVAESWRTQPRFLRYESVDGRSPSFVDEERLLFHEIVAFGFGRIATRQKAPEDLPDTGRRRLDVLRPLPGRRVLSTPIDGASAAVDRDLAETSLRDKLFEQRSARLLARSYRDSHRRSSSLAHVALSRNQAFLAIQSGQAVRVLDASSGIETALAKIDGTVVAVADDGRTVGVEALIDDVEEFLEVPLNGRPPTRSSRTRFRRLDFPNEVASLDGIAIVRGNDREEQHGRDDWEMAMVVRSFFLRFDDEMLTIEPTTQFFGPGFVDPGLLQDVAKSPNDDRLLLSGQAGIAVAAPIAEGLPRSSSAQRPFIGRRTTGTAWGATMSPDGRLVAVGYGEIGEVLIWDTITDRAIATFVVGSSSSALSGDSKMRPIKARPLCFSADQKTLWVRVDNALTMFRVGRPEVLATIDVDQGTTFLPTGIFSGDSSECRWSFIWQSGDPNGISGPNVLQASAAASAFRDEDAVRRWLSDVAKTPVGDPIPLPPRPQREPTRVAAKLSIDSEPDGSMHLVIDAAIPPGHTAEPVPMMRNLRRPEPIVRPTWTMALDRDGHAIFETRFDVDDLFPEGVAVAAMPLEWSVAVRSPSGDRTLVSEWLGFELPIPSTLIRGSRSLRNNEPNAWKALAVAAWRDNDVEGRRAVARKLLETSSASSRDVPISLAIEFVSPILTRTQADVVMAKELAPKVAEWFSAEKVKQMTQPGRHERPDFNSIEQSLAVGMAMHEDRWDDATQILRATFLNPGTFPENQSYFEKERQTRLLRFLAEQSTRP